MAVYVHQHRVNGNGHTLWPQSRRAFTRSLPGRLGGLEDQIDVHDRSVDEIRSRLTALESRAGDASDAARVELLRGILDIMRLALGKRRSRRSPANQLRLSV